MPCTSKLCECFKSKISLLNQATDKFQRQRICLKQTPYWHHIFFNSFYLWGIALATLNPLHYFLEACRILSRTHTRCQKHSQGNKPDTKTDSCPSDYCSANCLQSTPLKRHWPSHALAQGKKGKVPFILTTMCCYVFTIRLRCSLTEPSGWWLP